MLNASRTLGGLSVGAGRTVRWLRCCLSCLTEPYDPIEAKLLCQKEISGGHCVALCGTMFQLHAPGISPHAVLTAAHTHRKKKAKQKHWHAGVRHWSCSNFKIKTQKHSCGHSALMFEPWFRNTGVLRRTLLEMNSEHMVQIFRKWEKNSGFKQ